MITTIFPEIHPTRFILPFYFGLYSILVSYPMEILNNFEGGVRSALPPSVNSWIDEALSHQHPLSKDFPLMNPFHVLLIIAAYLISLPIGRYIMKDRKRLELKGFSMLHNFFLIVLSLYMCVESLRQAWNLGYGFAGNPVESSAKGLPVSRF